ncbi:MAG: ABC transporter substrate-binding protein [Bdellovibrionaceae bacterium]|nr:ABC transporter substrate-binding protein [Pseudobdellovibrionaceae bacterium]
MLETQTTIDNSAFAITKSKKIIRVKLPLGKEVPFSKNAPVDTIYATIAPILGQLIYTSNSYDLEAGLLRSFNWDFENSAYILKLKSGLKFHNGRAVTSKDLEFSITRGFYSSKPSFFLAFLNNIQGINAIKGKKVFVSGKVSGIKIIDEQTISVKLNEPNPSFLHSLARSYFSVVPIEALEPDYETWKIFPVGAGAYKVVKFSAKNDEITLVNVNKIDSSVDELIFYYKKTDTPMDIEISSHGNNKKVVLSKRSASLTGIYFNFNNSIARNIQFRKALDLAIDRKKLTEGVEIYTPANEFLANHFWGRIKPDKKTDINKAKKLLKEVKQLDLSKIFQIPVFNGKLTDPKYGLYASRLEEQLRKIGLNVKFIESEEKIFPSTDKETLFRLASLGADVADPIILFGLLRGKNSPLSPHFPLNDKSYENLFSKAQHTTTLDQRVMAVKKLSSYIHENTWTVPLFEKKLLVSINPNRIKDIGLQDGGLTFFVERATLK